MSDADTSAETTDHGVRPDLSQHHVKVTVDPEEITRIIGAFNEFVPEIRLDFRAGYIEILAVDNANVIAGHAKIDVEYETDFDSFTIGVATSELLDGVEFTDAFGEVTLRVEEDSDEVTITRDTFMDSVKLLPLVTVREPDDPFGFDTELTVGATVPALKFKGAVGAIAGNSGTTNLYAEDEQLVVENADYTGDRGDEYYTWRIDASVVGEAATTYTSRYLRHVTNALSPEGDVELEFGDCVPLLVRGSSMKLVVAPRIEQEVEA